MEKLYTVKEISETINVPIRTIHDAIDRHFPDIKKNGKTTWLTDLQVAIVSKELKIAHNSGLAKTRKVVMTKPEEDELIIQAMQIMKNRISELKPKAESYDRLISTENHISMGEFAKSIGWGRNNLLKNLRVLGIFDGYNTPYQSFMKYFKIRHIVKNGHDYPTAFINAKGVDYISKKIGKLLNAV